MTKLKNLNNRWPRHDLCEGRNKYWVNNNVVIKWRGRIPVSVVISKCKLWPPLPHRPRPHKLCPHTSFYYGHRATIIVPSASIFPRLMNDQREVFSNLFMVCIGVGEGVGQVWELIRGLASAPGFQQNVICYKFSPRSIVFFLVANFAKWARTGATGPVVTWSAVRVARTYSSSESRFMISLSRTHLNFWQIFLDFMLFTHQSLH